MWSSTWWDVLKSISSVEVHGEVYSEKFHIIKYMVRCTQNDLMWSSTWRGVLKTSLMMGCTHDNLACMWSSTRRGVLKTSLMWSSLSVTYGRPVFFSGFSSLVQSYNRHLWYTMYCIVESTDMHYIQSLLLDKCVCYAWELHEVFNTNLGSFLAITCWTRQITKRYTYIH